ncbi:MAG: bifunctional 5,6,7,8-tetrahydromethanopterin hydro-lyase/3-hexulose-6-phosphate synthase [Methanosarcina thermophila]|jgi:bifunctional enzyme Fae/Hps|uniref:Bifunctional enzyme Fae/Hps n=4 Tax=Methanosarcina thermophila TaxID=2210 RepID=A0A0E3NIA7_METTE|nr:bifunctional 5,6,7,8-tetrahydromethanopterin hydro-lyase/3-hexulose-6-phosphate synthase [Methanosarcina thermophila]ALK04835.1 MAG: bifunctional formaldehyde-activating protein/3-hexulose-6-phosphate synthase [Methanosarcina sp. 795]AKB13545.1 Formaldehyde activating enzyme [Methanosarcina thermophila TM-1]AKB15817.1 Formaldehyde activating enzyme [Methanosarcina thermophila CHTI-55]NLU57486.1 bifunctional 5,6,7,8-tetrahydromethanopterin hydro-lyase/3-hexulose-6-phosphate synthase [Methanos
MFQIGEALMGQGAELAHVDLMIGDKGGPVGQAFANGLTQLSVGHTPLLSVIRPNLPPKPSTLIVPKVTVKNMEQASKIFGPAQTAVAKAVADSVEEGIISKDLVEDIVIVASVFIHPDAQDYNKIYRYNYGATKLAIKRALEGFPSIDTVLEESNKSTHAIMGFKVTRLWDPPYLQIAFDNPNLESVLSAISQIPKSDHVIIEAGTPLIKRYGVDVISKIRDVRPDAFIVADLKTLDTGNLEARMVADAAGDAIVVSALAPISTIDKLIEEAHKTGIYAVMDTLNQPDPISVLKQLKVMPDVIELHRGIDIENTEHAWGNIEEIKKVAPKALVAVAGGVRLDKVPVALSQGADILVVGRAITNAKDVREVAEQFIMSLNKPEIDQFRVMTDF